MMYKNILLVRASQFYLAFPAEKLLEITLLNQSNKDVTNDRFTENFRTWRNTIFPVIHLGHYLDQKNLKNHCRYGVVYKANESDTFYLDLDEIFGIFHIQKTHFYPIHTPHKALFDISRTVCAVPNSTYYAFLVNDPLNLRPHIEINDQQPNASILSDI